MNANVRRSWAVVGAMMLTAAAVAADRATADDWPQWRGPERDGVWRESGIIDRFESDEIPLRWSVEIGHGYSGPTVADGRVYVTDRVGEPDEIERVHCFDAHSGEHIWSHSYEAEYGGIGYQAGPRASVLVQNGRAYSLGAVGHLFCFDAETGEVLWQRDLAADYNIEMPRWGIAGSPVIEGDLLLLQIGGEEACFIGLDKQTGEDRWAALDDDASYVAPIVIDQAGERVMVGYSAGRVVGLNPQTGELHWDFEIGVGPWPIAIATPVVYEDYLFVTNAHKGPALLRLASDEVAVEPVWHPEGSRARDADTLHSLIGTPLLQGGYIYGVHNQGQLRCLDLATGEQVWEDTSIMPTDRWATMHLIAQGDRVWIFNERGELVIARLSAEGLEEISRAKLLEPTREQLNRRGGVTWAHPAFAYRHVFARNDHQLVAADLSADD